MEEITNQQIRKFRFLVQKPKLSQSFTVFPDP